jgi:hypothetical protein
MKLVGQSRIFPDILRPLTSKQRELVRRIRESWGDTLEKNLEVGRCLLELRLPKRVCRLNLFNLPMTYSWSRRLIKITTDPRIRANLDRMPNARSTLHEITLLRKREFALAMARQVINPACTRQDIRDFVRSQRGSCAKTHLTVTFEGVGEVGKPVSEVVEHLAELLASIQKMVSEIFPSIQVTRHLYVRMRGEAHDKERGAKRAG